MPFGMSDDPFLLFRFVIGPGIMNDNVSFIFLYLFCLYAVVISNIFIYIKYRNNLVNIIEIIKSEMIME